MVSSWGKRACSGGSWGDGPLGLWSRGQKGSGVRKKPNVDGEQGGSGEEVGLRTEKTPVAKTKKPVGMSGSERGQVTSMRTQGPGDSGAKW